jgi:hypothetical protein
MCFLNTKGSRWCGTVWFDSTGPLYGLSSRQRAFAHHGELAKHHAVSEATKAVTKYTSSS